MQVPDEAQEQQANKRGEAEEEEEYTSRLYSRLFVISNHVGCSIHCSYGYCVDDYSTPLQGRVSPRGVQCEPHPRTHTSWANHTRQMGKNEINVIVVPQLTFSGGQYWWCCGWCRWLWILNDNYTLTEYCDHSNTLDRKTCDVVQTRSSGEKWRVCLVWSSPSELSPFQYFDQLYCRDTQLMVVQTDG